MTQEQSPKNKWNSRRIVAIAGIILLAALYVISLIVAIVDKSSSGTWFFLSLIATVTIPLLIWIYTWMYGMLSQKHTMASFDLGKNPSKDTSDAGSESSEN